jgi:hypothetical protein
MDRNLVNTAESGSAATLSANQLPWFPELAGKSDSQQGTKFQENWRSWKKTALRAEPTAEFFTNISSNQEA